MRVAYVCADPGVPVWGSKGSSVHVQEVLRALLARGAQLDLICAAVAGAAPDDLAAVRVHHVALSKGLEPAAREQALLAANTQIAAILAQLGQLDLVYERHSLFSHAAMRHARETAARGVLEVNAPLIDEQARHRTLVDRAGAEHALRSSLADADVAIAVSEPVAAWLRERSPEPERVHVVPNGVDVRRLRPRRAQRRDSGCTIGFVGSLKPWHGVETLVDALALLRREESDWNALIVGDGPRAESLRERARDLGVLEHTELTGAVAPSAVGELLARFDFAVAPYPAADGTYFSPLKLYEYLAAGLPIVASSTAATRSVLTDGQDGVLVTPGDPRAFADALAGLRREPQRRHALARRARRNAVRNHTWERRVACILRLAGATTATTAVP